MSTTTKKLHEDRIYLAHARFVCGTIHCAGSTAVHTGRNLNGVKVSPVTADDVREWASYDMGDLTCECGRLTATGILNSDGYPITREH